MIRTRKELKFYISADRMMNRGYFKLSYVQRIKNLFIPDNIMTFLTLMRKCQYYSELRGGVNRVAYIYYRIRYQKIGLRLGFSIGHRVFGYGLVIPHHGTIVVGGSNRIGNYCVLHTSTCITDNAKVIGNGLYFSTGAKMTRHLILGDNVSVAANSVVNSSFPDGNVLLVGMPAQVKSGAVPWYERDGETYANKVRKIEKLKIEMGL